MEIQNYPNYLIYEDGKVFSKYTNKYLKACPSGAGYLQVSLTKDKKHKPCSIHRLVAEHYIPNPNNLPSVDHINRIKTDNRVENLRWADMKTQRENQGPYKHRCDNKSGHKNICFHKPSEHWYYEKKLTNGIRIRKNFKNKIDAICYKYIINLRLKANHFR